jgi:hypothetical protein
MVVLIVAPPAQPASSSAEVTAPTATMFLVLTVDLRGLLTPPSGEPPERGVMVLGPISARRTVTP